MYSIPARVRSSMGVMKPVFLNSLPLLILIHASILTVSGSPEQVPDSGSGGQSSAQSHHQEMYQGFGVAKHFMPLAHVVVGAHCTWSLRLNTIPKRIPETITEVLCHNSGASCGGSPYYTCKQMKAKMLVAHTEPVETIEGTEWRLRAVRNITINIGCSCVYREPVLLHQYLPGPQEKRSGFTPRLTEFPTNEEANFEDKK